MNEDKKNEILEKINEVFVDDFNMIKNSQEKINDYLKSFEIKELYNYNEFCIEFINSCNNILDNVSDEDFNYLKFNYFITEILSEMVRTKISNSDLDEEKKEFSLMKLGLDKYVVKNISK